MNYLEETGLSFEKGQGLSAAALNTMNNTINNLVKSVNMLLSEVCDLNVETDNFEKTYTLTQAIKATPRRSRSMKLRFLDTDNDGAYSEYSYIGESVEDEDWNSLLNWAQGPSVVDGGLWGLN